MSTYFNKSFNPTQTEGPSYLKEFLDYKRQIENLSMRTVFNYYVSLRVFFRWIIYREDESLSFDEIDISPLPFSKVEEITKQDIMDFLAFCDYDRSNSSDSRATKLSALKAFYKYYTDVVPRITTVNPVSNIPHPKQAHRVPKYLSDSEAQELLDAGIPETVTISGCSRPNPTVKRDVCIITWFLNCGMRLAELKGINFPDIRKDNDMVTLLLRGKGNKERTILLNDACIEAFNAYRTERSGYAKDYDEKAVFISPRTGKRLGDRAIEEIVERALKNSGLDGRGYSAHKLRHTTATKMFQSGVADTLTIGRVLGHASPSSTQIYAHGSMTQIAEAMTHTQFKKTKE